MPDAGEIKFFSVIDIQSEYHQVEILEEHRVDRFLSLTPLFLRVQQDAVWTYQVEGVCGFRYI